MSFVTRVQKLFFTEKSFCHTLPAIDVLDSLEIHEQNIPCLRDIPCEAA